MIIIGIFTPWKHLKLQYWGSHSEILLFYLCLHTTGLASFPVCVAMVCNTYPRGHILLQADIVSMGFMFLDVGLMFLLFTVKDSRAVDTCRGSLSVPLEGTERGRVGLELALRKKWKRSVKKKKSKLEAAVAMPCTILEASSDSITPWSPNLLDHFFRFYLLSPFLYRLMIRHRQCTSTYSCPPPSSPAPHQATGP